MRVPWGFLGSSSGVPWGFLWGYFRVPWGSLEFLEVPWGFSGFLSIGVKQRSGFLNEKKVLFEKRAGHHRTKGS